MRTCMIELRSTPMYFPPGYALRIDRTRQADAGEFRALTTSARAYLLEHGSLESGVTALTWVGCVRNYGRAES